MIYPKNMQQLFTNRDHELTLLKYLQKQHLQGGTQHGVLFGLRRIGKTLLFKEVIKRTLVENDNIVPICQRLLQLQILYDLEISPEAVKQAFLIETLSNQGKIYDYCRYIYDTSLQRARGFGALKSILQLLAEEDGLPLAEIARRLKVTAPTASEYLRWLMEVDLIIKKNGYFEDSVFKYWLQHTTKGIEVDSRPQVEDLWGLVKRLDESFQRTSSELGHAIEGKIYQVMNSFDNQLVKQNIFFEMPLGEEIVLPKFKKIFPYQSPDNLIEIDLLAEGDETWAVEIKWKNKSTILTELQQFYTKAKDLSDYHWFISRSGFSSAAINFARENNMILSDRASIEAIAERLGVRFVK